ncbi:MAG: aminopeptidase N [Hamadaea sp.]|uniref:aminopeptidase N n=1 Tax=Hamadaea sp. TaxID=2024425 RepID=UPI00183660B0|nr:aminopeptidase N [Hamadaea sp.]NUR72205.1 aminopeptidase N [Hamadaea sp.]NUT18622.1 aminopeptidase N [Hamadaea sp.]
MAAIRNITQTEAVERAATVEVAHYDIQLDLTDGDGGPGEGTFRSRTEVTFLCHGTETAIDIAAERLIEVTLNGQPQPLDLDSVKGYPLPTEFGSNVLVVEGEFAYSSSGQGLHRAVDPVDGEVYVYSSFCPAESQRAYACFDQPDLKAEFTWHVTVPGHWLVTSTMPVAEITPLDDGAKVVHFQRSPRMSSYVAAVCAGPFHEVRDEHDGIDLGLYCRASVAEHLDPAEFLEVTKRGLDHFQGAFGIRYPLPKYDQLLLPEYNMGAMENFGCVTFSEDLCLFRSKATDVEYEWRAMVIMHEMAHMWFGDLVTLRWWDDLWLNESFADWAGYWAVTSVTRHTGAWATFLATAKAEAYRQDQLSSTHPIYTEVPDTLATESNFDAITYSKGASVLKQLVAYVGEETFLAAVRAHLTEHAWGNATFADLLRALEQAGGRDLGEYARRWLRTAEVNTLRPEIEVDADGAYRAVVIRQETPESHPTLRDHRIAIGLYDLTDGRLVRRTRIEADVTGDRTDVADLRGQQQPDVLLLNDDDLAYAKVRLDDRSASTLLRHLSAFPHPMQRALAWSAAWDMVCDAELPARAYVGQVAANLPAESDANLASAVLTKARRALARFTDPGWQPTGWATLHSATRTALDRAEPGSDLQQVWARTYADSARTPAEIAVLLGWLRGDGVPDGLVLGVDLRWHVVKALAALGAIDSPGIAAELERDSTASGRQHAAHSGALLPTAAAKADAWERLTRPGRANWEVMSLGSGFQHTGQEDVTAPYADRYFAEVQDAYATFDAQMGLWFANATYPSLQISAATLEASDAWLAGSDRPAALRRVVMDGRDGVVRALRARARDAA